MAKNTYGFKLKKEKDFLNALTLEPDNIHNRLRLADLYIRKKKKEKALEQYKIAAEKLQVTGKTHSAKAIYKLILNIDPHWGDIKDIVFDTKTVKTNLNMEKFKESELKSFLKSIEIFQDLSDTDINEIANTLNIKKFSTGDFIIKQGEEGDSIFVILQGSVRVFYDDEIGKVIELAYLTKGDFFGEMGFFGNKKRRASVTSVDDTVLLELKKENIDKLIKKHEAIEETFFQFYQNRILDLIVATTPIFYPLDADVRKELVKKFNLVKFKAGELIVKEGESSNSMFIIKSGEVKVSKDGNEITKLGPSDFFGEIGLITGQQRTADIFAITDVELMELKKEDIDFIVIKYTEVLNILKDYIKERTTDTFSKLMELKRLSAKEGIV